jgi:hypothetical protein
MQFPSGSGLFLLCASLLSLSMRVSTAAAEPQFPLVLSSPAELIPFGILIRPPGDTRPIPSNFNTRCYDGTDISSGEPEFLISDQLMSDYRAKGFTRESLCMGLASRTAYDPESGRRLPTYILRDQARIVSALEEKLAEARSGGSIPAFDNLDEFAAAVDAVKREDFSRFSQQQYYDLFTSDRGHTWERPLVVPDCYKNATPYLDCDFEFGVSKGKPYRDKKKAREFGIALDKQLKDALASGRPLGLAQPGADEIMFLKQELPNGLYEGQPDAVKVPQSLMSWDESVDWIMVSKALPRGYGYTFKGLRFPDGAFTLTSVVPQKSSKKVEPQTVMDVIKSFF